MSCSSCVGGFVGSPFGYQNYGYGYNFGLDIGQGSYHNGYRQPCNAQTGTAAWIANQRGDWRYPSIPYPTIPQHGYPTHWPYYIPSYSGIPMDGCFTCKR
jgi:hypothetical protein